MRFLGSAQRLRKVARVEAGARRTKRYMTSAALTALMVKCNALSRPVGRDSPTSALSDSKLVTFLKSFRLIVMSTASASAISPRNEAAQRKPSMNTKTRGKNAWWS